MNLFHYLDAYVFKDETIRIIDKESVIDERHINQDWLVDEEKRQLINKLKGKDFRVYRNYGNNDIEVFIKKKMI